MKRMCTGLALALAAMVATGFAPAASSQEPAAGGYKIGVVDVKAVLRDYNKRQQKYDQLQSEVKTRQGRIDAISNEIEGMKKDYDSKKGSASAEELSALESKIKTRYTDYKAEMDKNQQAIDDMEKTVLQDVIGDVEAKINEIAQAENYHLILNGTRGGGSSVLYSSSTIDLTARVTTALNGGGGGSAPAPAPAAAPAEDGKKKKK